MLPIILETVFKITCGEKQWIVQTSVLFPYDIEHTMQIENHER